MCHGVLMRTLFLLVLLAFLTSQLPAAPTASAASAPSGTELQKFEQCRLVTEAWSDGDSFPICLPDKRVLTIRIYGADCLEAHTDGDDSNARRLRDQRRYFGIRDIAVAKSYGKNARQKVAQWLEHPFTVHTAFADGRGDARYQRVYAFVTLSGGEDLATRLVKEGLARAFGVTRTTPWGDSAKEYQARLRDVELAAAKAGLGAWAATDWQRLPEERAQARAEAEEIESAKAPEPLVGKINPNTAARDELLRLPGIGESMANRILAARQQKPLKRPDDLLEVPGIGPATLKRLMPYLEFPSGH